MNIPSPVPAHLLSEILLLFFAGVPVYFPSPWTHILPSWYLAPFSSFVLIQTSGYPLFLPVVHGNDSAGPVPLLPSPSICGSNGSASLYIPWFPVRAHSFPVHRLPRRRILQDSFLRSGIHFHKRNSFPPYLEDSLYILQMNSTGCFSYDP